MTTALQTSSKTELMARYDRLRGSIARVRETAKTSVKRGTHLALAGVGGFAAGAIDAKIPEVMGMPTSVAVGLALGVLGVVDGAGDASDHLVALGSGMVAGASYQKGREFGAGLQL